MLTVTIGTESLCSGLASTAFIAYISNFCKGKFNVAHFTLLYSLASFSRVLVSTLAGWIADTSCWTFLFSLTSTSCLPVIYFLLKIHHKQKQSNKKELSNSLTKVGAI
jgi:PAT family beta-lactamase induction signal transducer AmpG